MYAEKYLVNEDKTLTKMNTVTMTINDCSGCKFEGRGCASLDISGYTIAYGDLTNDEYFIIISYDHTRNAFTPVSLQGMMCTLKNFPYHSIDDCYYINEDTILASRVAVTECNTLYVIVDK